MHITNQTRVRCEFRSSVLFQAGRKAKDVKSWGYLFVLERIDGNTALFLYDMLFRARALRAVWLFPRYQVSSLDYEGPEYPPILLIRWHIDEYLIGHSAYYITPWHNTMLTLFKPESDLKFGAGFYFELRIKLKAVKLSEFVCS